MDAAAVGIPLAIGADGTVVAAEGRLGRGRVVRVWGALLANDRIGDGGQLELALRLVEDLRGRGSVGFDEFHHGYGGALGARARSYAPALVAAGVQAAAVTLLFAFARGVRFGPARASLPPRRRSSLEYVRAIAGLYRRARAHPHLVAGALDRFERRARAELALDDAASLDTLGQAAAERAGVDRTRARATIAAAERARRTEPMGEREAIAVVRDLARLENEVFGGERTGS
jgi:hypothetical protein